MRVLFVSALLPYPPHQGGQVRLYNLLKHLAAQHEITLFSFIRFEEERKFLGKLSFCAKVETIMRGQAWQPRYVLSAGLGVFPFLWATYNNAQMKQLISHELSQQPYDLVHLEPSYVWPSLPRTHVPAVVCEHNIESSVYTGFVRRFPLGFFRPFLFWDVVKLWWWERRVWKSSDQVVVVSEEDARVIRKVIPRNRVSLVPNGVEVGMFTFKPKIGSYRTTDPVTVLFVGYFGWLQNRDALAFLLDDIWPKLQERLPKAKLTVVGKRLPQSLKEKVSAVSGVYLPEVADIVGEYHRADVLLAPIRVGGGTRYKILEAMATGVPVVTTTTGAAGLAVKNGKLLIADDPSGMVEAVVSVIKNTRLRLALTREARKLVEDLYSWDHLANKLEGVWRHVKANR